MLKPEIGTGCASGTQCCRFLGEFKGKWWWWRVPEDSFCCDIIGQDRPQRHYGKVPDELLHNYAALKLESSS